jgi:hypothetical protein
VRHARTDVNTFIGPYPWRHLPHPDPDVLVRVLAREGFTSAWVGYLPSAFHRDPSAGNEALVAATHDFPGVLLPVPVVRPDWPRWDAALRDAADSGAPAIRAYPSQWSMAPDDPAMLRLSAACDEAGLALVLTVRFEDLRQRHPLDVAGDLSAAAIRALARARTSTRIVVTAAGRDLIEEVHWGLTDAERSRLFWDFSWVWGPPENDLAHLLSTVGADRFVCGTGWPLRLTQNVRANLALLPSQRSFAALADPSQW